MATGKKRMYLIWNGPGLLELQFSDYNPAGHTVEFTVEQTVGADVRGEIFRISGTEGSLTVQVTGSDRVERDMKDDLGRDIPRTARLIRVRYGNSLRFKGWFNPGSPRRGLLREV